MKESNGTELCYGVAVRTLTWKVYDTIDGYYCFGRTMKVLTITTSVDKYIKTA